MPTPNPWKAQRQLDRARKIAAATWADIPREKRTNADIPEKMAAADPIERYKVALAVNLTTPPSDVTWAMAVDMVREFVTDERRWLGLEERVG